MNHHESYFKNVAVVGAAGKMGSGISLLILTLIGEEFLLKKELPPFTPKLTFIDVSMESLNSLRNYLRTQLLKKAEKLKQPPTWVDCCFELTHFTTELPAGAGAATLVFEAIPEIYELKKETFLKLIKVTSPDCLYLTNTSSIPISTFEKEIAPLKGKILGFHFYNPPAIQKLLEIIKTPNSEKDLLNFGLWTAEKLQKIVVIANDIAGFIGNGHFIRDGLYALKQVEKYQEKYSLEGGIYLFNKVTQEGMIRPMGIFQLIDYVGLDIFVSISKVMAKYLEGDFDPLFLNRFLELNIKGGQFPDGKQKDGIFRYENGQITGVYSLKEQTYLSLQTHPSIKEVEKIVYPLPPAHKPWKELVKSPSRELDLKLYFNEIWNGESTLATLSKEYLLHSKSIALKLVQDGVAKSTNDVNTVLTNGFYHLYGACNDYY